VILASGGAVSAQPLLQASPFPFACPVLGRDVAFVASRCSPPGPRPGARLPAASTRRASPGERWGPPSARRGADSTLATLPLAYLFRSRDGLVGARRSTETSSSSVEMLTPKRRPRSPGRPRCWTLSAATPTAWPSRLVPPGLELARSFPPPPGSDTMPGACRPAVQFNPLYPAGHLLPSRTCAAQGPPD